MPVQAQPLDHQRVELPGQEVGEVERARLGVGQRVEHRLAGIEGVAVRPADPLHALLGQHPVELAARAAIGIEHQDPGELGPMLADLRPHRLRDLLRPVVEQARKGR